MSSQSTQTAYVLSILGNSSAGSITMTSVNDGWSDAFALELQGVLQGLIWPPGTSFSILKTETVVDTSTAGGSPAAFT